MSKFIGLTDKRPLPHYTGQRFDRWFRNQVATRNQNGESALLPGVRGGSRGEVILWDDTFVRYHEPQIGIAAVHVLEALGFRVSLVTGRKCCGRPAFSQGNFEAAARLGRHNLELVRGANSDAALLFLEPSCYSMFVEDYRELKLPDSQLIAKRCYLFEEFVDNTLEREPDALQFNQQTTEIAIHAHCHAKALTKPAYMTRLARRLPGRTAILLETGCCGMAGAFGALDSKYELSLKVAAPLVEQISAQPVDAIVIASGTSCRHQIEHLTPRRPKHMAQLLAEALC
jgi:Fe-S oxidoreductase